jgi:tripartite-type tricarboxylate transporter receptor subunit TctC
MTGALIKRLAPLWLLAALVSAPATAQDFYAGKTVTITVSTGAGGTYDSIARLLARHMPHYLPGTPSMIVQNMPGAGNVLATNYMYNLAPKDGTSFATVNNAIPLNQVLDGRGVRYDTRRFGWLGSPGSYNSVLMVWKSAGARSFKDVTEREITVGGTGAGSSNIILPTAMNAVLGAKLKIVLGYKDVAELYLAVERGEIQGFTTSYTGALIDRPEWFSQNKIDIVAQIGAKRHPALPDIPLITELARSDEQREILKLISSPNALGEPFLAPPDLPPDRLALLRQAFARSMKDEGFVAEMQKLHIDIDMVSAEEVTRIVKETIEQPPEIVAKAKAAMEAAP